jgi:ATP-dependent Clp protease ATP-binding subunit ClpC
MKEALTESTLRVLALAVGEVRQRGDKELGTHHLFIALLQESAERTDSLTGQVLTEFDVTLERIRGITKVIDVPSSRAAGPLWFNLNAKRCIELALAQAYSLGRSRIAPEHLLIGLIEKPDFAPARILYELGVSTEELRSRLRQLLVSSTIPI